MDDMFHKASSFNQDLGWCVNGDVELKNAFKGTKCASTSCGIKTSCPSESDEVGGITYQPTYQPTYKPSLRGSDGCADDADWLYDAGDKGLKGCDHIASEPAKVDKRCSRRVGEDGVPALEACKQTCGKC